MLAEFQQNDVWGVTESIRELLIVQGGNAIQGKMIEDANGLLGGREISEYGKWEFNEGIWQCIKRYSESKWT